MLQNKIPIIVGSGRSGTTWVQDALAWANGYSTAFEPLHPDVFPEIAQYASSCLTSSDDCPTLRSFLLEVYSGRIENAWVNYRVRPDRLRPSLDMILKPRKAHEWVMRWRKLLRHYNKYHKDRGKPVLVKFIRANLMLPWLSHNFDSRIVYIVRHPGAVIESQIRLGGEDWDPDRIIDKYLSQDRCLADILEYVDISLLKTLTQAGKHALIWCVENAALLKDWKSMAVHRVYFEDLVRRPEETWSGLCEYLGLPDVPELQNLNRASQQARPEQQNKSYDASHLNRWRMALSDMQMDEVQSVLDLFGVLDYNMRDDFPVAGASA